MNLQAKLNSLPFQPLLFIPKTVEELWSYALILTNNDTNKAGDLALCYSVFGHHFDFDLGRVYVNTHVISGKPSLNSDGLAAIARSSGLIRFMHFTVLTDERCVYEMARVDEPEDIVHTYEYTIKDAEAAGHLNKAMWKKHRRSMLRVRALAGICRAVVPDAVSGVYSIDEMADSVSMSEQDREMVIAQSIGEDVSRAPQPQRAPNSSQAFQPQRASQPAPQPQRVPEPSRPPQPQRAPEPSRPPQPQPAPEVGKKPTPVKRFSSMADLARALEHHDISRSEAVDVANRLNIDLEAIDADERTEFFYSWLISSTIRQSRLQPNWWRDKGNSRATVKQLRDEFPTLPVDADSRDIGINLANPYFWEGLSVSAHLEDEESIEAGRQIMREIINGSEDVALLLQLSRL